MGRPESALKRTSHPIAMITSATGLPRPGDIRCARLAATTQACRNGSTGYVRIHRSLVARRWARRAPPFHRRRMWQM
jgi:hypothetical protein